MSDDLTARIRLALDAKPGAKPDIEPDRLAEILNRDGMIRPLELALIAEAAGVSPEWLLTGDPLGAVKVILDVAQDPTTWLLDGAHDISFGRHAAMAKTLAGILDRHTPDDPIPSYFPCRSHGLATAESMRDCPRCRRLADHVTCSYCETLWPCDDVRTIAAHIDPGAFDVIKGRPADD